MSLPIDNEIKDRVRSATDIADLLGSYMQLRRQGANYVGLCPFHEDRKPSLQINIARQIWKCWVCDVGGDVFSFLMQKEQLSFPEALATLAERAGIDLPKRGSGGGATQTISTQDKRALYEAMKWTVSQYHQCLLDDPAAQAAREYLDGRGIDEHSVAKFKLGFAPAEWNWLGDRFARDGKNLKTLEQIGVMGKSERGSLYDRFRGRVIFPIADAQGRFVSLGGRLMPGEPDNQAKYVNCSETRLYQKNQQLYGLDLGRADIASSRTAVVMEGYTDVIMASQSGISNAVAVCGTALGEGHLRLLQRYCDQVVLVLDGDEAGRRRATEILEMFLGHQLDLRLVTLPDNLDPCDFLLQRDSEQLRDLIVNAVDALEFKISQLLGDIDPYEDTQRANNALEKVLALVAKATPKVPMAADGFRLRQDQIVLRLSRRFGVETGLLRSRLDSYQKRDNNRRQMRSIVPNNTSRQSASKPLSIDPNDLFNEAGEQAIEAELETLQFKQLSALEREFFEILVQHEELIPLALEQFDHSKMETAAAKALLKVYVDCDFNGIDLDFDSIITIVEDVHIKSMLVSVESLATSKTARLPLDARERLMTLSEQISQLDSTALQHQRMKRLEAADLEAEEQLRLLQEVFNSARDAKGWKMPDL